LRILIYGLNYAPELTGIGKYTGEMAEWLASRGHDVHVVTAPPYYPAWFVRDEYRNPRYRTEYLPGHPVVYRTPLYVPAEPTGIKRVLHLVSFMLGSIPVMLREIFWEPDVVFTVEPTFFGAPLALFVARVSGAMSWLHIQDFEVDAAFDLGLLPSGGLLQTVALSLEEAFTGAFSAVSSISTKMVDRLDAKGIPSDRTILFPNWVDIEEIYPLPPEKNNFKAELGLEGKIILLYSGNMGNKQGLELLAPLAMFFGSDPRIHFLFCGDGTFRPHLEKQTSHLPNVTFLPLQPLERLNDLLNTADIHLLPQRPGAADLVMPSKLTGMLSSGRPVIALASPGTQVAKVVEGRGLVVLPDDEVALHLAVKQLVDDEPLRHKFGKAARCYAVRRLGREEVLNCFERDLETHLQQSLTAV
jgi:colanic acid biosynthesis glycosyl transferase WcaI